jgi:small conductance mechanosensitive channel
MQIAGIDIILVTTVVMVLMITYVVARIISKTLTKILEKTSFPENIEKSMVRISKYAIYIIGVLVATSVSGLDLTSVIVGLGAFSIAISFAMSNVIQNFVSGILVQTDRVFQVGDEIKVQNFEGKVVKVSIRTTSIESENGDLVSIPNSLFLTSPLVRKKRDKTMNSNYA